MRRYFITIISIVVFAASARAQAPLIVVSGRINISEHAVSRDGTLLVTASIDDDINVWSLQTGLLISSFKNKATIYALDVSGDNKMLLVGLGGTRTLQLHEVMTGKLIRTLPQAHEKPSGIFVSDDKYVYGVNVAGQMITWETATGRVVQSNKLKLDGEDAWLLRMGIARSIRWYRSHDRKTVIVVDDKKSEKIRGYIWNIATPQGTRELWLPHDDVKAITNDGKVLAVVPEASRDELRTPELISSENARLIRRLEPVPHLIVQTHFSPDGKYMASRLEPSKFEDGTSIAVWDTSTGKLLWTVTPLKRDYTRNFSLTADGTRIVVESKDAVRIYAVETGRLIATFFHFSAGGVVTKPSGALVLSGVRDEVLRDEVGRPLSPDFIRANNNPNGIPNLLAE